jgi:hypothetical protein
MMTYDQAEAALLRTRSEGKLSEAAELVTLGQRYVELVEGDPASGAVTVSIVRAWCGAFQDGARLQRHLVDPSGCLIRIDYGA